MKNIIFMLIMFASHSCTAQNNADSDVVKITSSVSHSGFVFDTAGAANWIFFPNDSLTFYKRKCDSLASALQLANFRLARIKKYNQIAIKHPSQAKWLTGWIRRSLQ